MIKGLSLYVTSLMNCHLQYTVRIVGSGHHPITGEPLPHLEEVLTVWSMSRQGAYKRAHLTTTLQFTGHYVQTFIDDIEHFDSSY